MNAGVGMTTGMGIAACDIAADLTGMLFGTGLIGSVGAGKGDITGWAGGVALREA